MIDLFGLGKHQDPAEPAASPSSEAPARGSHKLWAFLLVFDAIFVIVFAGAVAAKIYQYWNAAPVAAARRRPAMKPIKAAETPAAASTAPPVAAEPAKAAEPTIIAAPKPAEAPAADAAAGKVKALKVEFKLHAPKARSVQLVGAFIVRGGRRDMTRQDDGAWTATLYLNPGRYRYFFAVDKKKRLDPENPLSEKGASLLTLP